MHQDDREDENENRAVLESDDESTFPENGEKKNIFFYSSRRRRASPLPLLLRPFLPKTETGTVSALDFKGIPGRFYGRDSRREAAALTTRAAENTQTRTHTVLWKRLVVAFGVHSLTRRPSTDRLFVLQSL